MFNAKFYIPSRGTKDMKGSDLSLLIKTAAFLAFLHTSILISRMSIWVLISSYIGYKGAEAILDAILNYTFLPHIWDVYPSFFQSPMGPLQGSRVKIKGHMIAHRILLSPRTMPRMHQFLSAVINLNPSCPRCPWTVCRIKNETCFIWNITVITSRFIMNSAVHNSHQSTNVIR